MTTKLRRRTLDVDLVDAGPLDGDIIVLLHGFPQTGQAWAQVAAGLNAAGYRTLAPTLRGDTPALDPRAGSTTARQRSSATLPS